MTQTIKVGLTGAAGNIGYAMLFRIASGEIFGHDTRIEFRLLEVPQAMRSLEGVVMEIEDAAFPLIQNVTITDDPKVAFDGVNWALLVGGKPRKKGMRRSDLILDNGPVFVEHGKALTRAAHDLQVLVVANPANTNCRIAATHARGVPVSRFAALSRLDENRASAQLALKAGVKVSEVTNMTVWGNHSRTQYPDAENAKIQGVPVYQVIDDHDWLKTEFVTTVQNRGTAIIEARNISSIASAASAALDHVMSMQNRTPEGTWYSAAVVSDGSYGIDEGIVYSFPLISQGKGYWSVVQGLQLSDWAQEQLQITLEELRQERDTVADLLKPA